MAAGSSNYNRGEMEINAQSGTFTGFMSGTKYGGVAIMLVVVMPVLVFALGLHWMPSLAVTVVLGILAGIGLKFKGGWYVGLIATAILTAITCVLLSLVA